MEMPISYTTSFESNLGSLTDERTSPVSHSYHPSIPLDSNPAEGKSSGNSCSSSSGLLFPNNGAWKRQSYRSIAINSRLRLQQGKEGSSSAHFISNRLKSDETRSNKNRNQAEINLTSSNGSATAIHFPSRMKDVIETRCGID